MSGQESKKDLEHFLRLAHAQVRYRLKGIETKEPYSSRASRLRLLEELIKEQLPNENPGHSTRATR